MSESFNIWGTFRFSRFLASFAPANALLSVKLKAVLITRKYRIREYTSMLIFFTDTTFRLKLTRGMGTARASDGAEGGKVVFTWQGSRQGWNRAILGGGRPRRTYQWPEYVALEGTISEHLLLVMLLAREFPCYDRPSASLSLSLSHFGHSFLQIFQFLLFLQFSYTAMIRVLCAACVYISLKNQKLDNFMQCRFLQNSFTHFP